MKAINISAREIQELDKLPPDTVLISINQDGEEPYKYKFYEDKERILRISFWDTVTVVSNNNKRYDPIDRDKTKKILNFIEKHKNRNFIINCRQGVSRSAAICLFLNLTFWHNLKEDFWATSEPNVYILGCLMAEYHRVNKTYIYE